MKTIRKYQRLTNKDYANVIKKIRPFVSFDYNLKDVKKNGLSAYDKSQVKKYYNTIARLNVEMRQQYKPRNKTTLRNTQKTEHGKSLKYLKVAFVYTGSNKKEKIVSKKNKTIIESKNYSLTKILVEKNDLPLFLTAPDILVKKYLKNYRDKLKTQFFRLKSLTAPVGESTDSKERLISIILNYMRVSKYENLKFLEGFVIYRFKNQASKEKYFLEFSKSKRKKKQRSKKRK